MKKNSLQLSLFHSHDEPIHETIAGEELNIATNARTSTGIPEARFGKDAHACREEGDVRESIRKIEVVKIEGVRRGKDGEHRKGQTTERETSPEGTEVKGEERKDIEDTRKREKGMEGWREEFIKMKKEIKEGIREQGRWMKEEMEEIRKEFKRMEIRRLQEREELKGEIKGLKEKVGKLEENLREKVVGDKGNVKGKEEEIEKKIRGIERRLEIRERERGKEEKCYNKMIRKEGRRKKRGSGRCIENNRSEGGD
ncbi:hypothetical protein X777_01159 [Ooceraea biroi]|uniref:Uncharacterized protein n=1 Tax=Ooceraea biroi TaxID=2015173 RepID=A0A026X5T6_OOCBI|nr:hypothetical protein X777_01159 [Ooceraea biroi]